MPLKQEVQEVIVIELVGLQVDTRFINSPGDGLLVIHPWGFHQVQGISPEAVDRLEKSKTKPIDIASVSGDRNAERVALRFLAALPFLMVRTIAVNGDPALRLDPLGEAASPAAAELTAQSQIALSRFAYCRRLGEECVLESPLALYRASLLTPGLGGVITMLTRPRTVAELLEEQGIEARLLAELVGAGLLHAVAPHGEGEEGLADDPALHSWSFHELLFHTRSRGGRHDYPSGPTYPLGTEREFPPAVKPPKSGETIPLPRPNLINTAEADLSFTEVLESRRSIRDYGPEGISAEQLGEFLYRTLRVRDLNDPLPGVPYQTTSRPYPSGGRAYELEAYLAVHRCTGLDRGVYHYNPLRHELVRLHRAGPQLADLLGSYRPSVSATPDVLMVLTCRFQRLNLKYESFSYGLALRNLGALYQTMYLTATSMKLAACAIGNGNSQTTDQVLGLDFIEESTIGEFVLGSMPLDADHGGTELRQAPVFLDDNDANRSREATR